MAFGTSDTRPWCLNVIAKTYQARVIVSDALYADAELMPTLRGLPALTPLTRDVFDGATAERRLAAFFARGIDPRLSPRD